MQRELLSVGCRVILLSGARFSDGLPIANRLCRRVYTVASVGKRGVLLWELGAHTLPRYLRLA